ncbi:MAG TPA: ATP-binding cassette domain-containing protein, partial [Gammaproteobacteria bacterium]|nr:ATP-binding cassette domain-containing protein [Gammaproteobacteria bacterium]
NYQEKATALLDNLGILSKAKDYPQNLSGGQKQRVALARSLMMEPNILLCDEPTSGLDVATTSEVVTLLRSVRKMGVTMLIASHDLDFLTKVSDKIVLLKNGKIVVNVDPNTLQEPIHYLKTYY